MTQPIRQLPELPARMVTQSHNPFQKDFIIRGFTNYTLHTKVIVAFVAVTLLSIGLVTFVTDRITRTNLAEEVGGNLKGLANSQARAVGDLLLNQVDLLRSLGADTVVQDEVTASNAAYTSDPAAIQTRLEQLDQQWRAADAVNNNADPLVQARLNNKFSSELKEFRNTFPNHVEVFVTDQYGALVATTNRTSDYYQADEAWWQAAFNNGQGAIYIDPLPEFDESSQTFGLKIAVPLHAPRTRTVIGVLRTTYRLTDLGKLLDLAQLGSKDHSALLLPEGQILSVDDLSLVPAAPDMLAQLQASATTNYGELTFEGKPGLVSQASMAANVDNPAITNLGWRVIVRQDRSEALAPADAQTRTILLLILLIGGLAVAAAFGLAQLLIGPITRLTAIAQRVTAGDLEVQAAVESRDETGQLAEAFNQMTAQLRSLIGSLEDQVRDRTAELALSMEVGQRTAAIRSLNELLPTITEYIRTQFNLYYTQVYFVDDLGQNLLLRAGTGSVGVQLLARRHQLPIGLGSIVGRVAAEGKSIVVADTQNSEIHKANPLLPETHSELAIPLIVEGRVIGVLDMQADKVNTFTENNLTVFEAMATQLAVSVDSAQQWERGQAAQRKAEEALKQLTHQSWVERLASPRESLAFAYDLVQVVPVLEVDSEVTNGGKKLEAPVIVQNEPIGQLVVKAPSQRALSTDAQALLAAVAQQLGQKAENLRLFEQTQHRAAREQLARQISDKVRASRDIEGALKTAAEELSKALGTARAVVDLKVTQDDEVNG